MLSHCRSEDDIQCPPIRVLSESATRYVVVVWKRQICNYQAPNLDSNTLDIYKQLLLKTFFDSVQKDPSQEQFTFRTLHSKSEKKKFFLC